MGAPLAKRDRRTRNITLIRVFRLIRLLRRRPHWLHELAQELDVTTRTIRRDLALLEEVHVPVWQSEHTGRWHIDRRYLEDVA